MNLPRLIITGANGYIGTNFCRYALKEGFKILVLGSPPKLPKDINLLNIPWVLGAELSLENFNSNDVILHFAHDWNSDEQDSIENNLNLKGTLLLQKQMEKSECNRFIFISSTSAHEEAKNIYGKIKLKIENELTEKQCQNIVIARLGLVYGNEQRGLFGTLAKIVTKFPIIPVIGKNIMLQPIHVNEVASCLISLTKKSLSKKKCYILASPNAISFGDWLKLLRFSLTGKKLLLISIPLNFALFLCYASQFIPFSPQINRERIYGLIAARVMTSENDLAEINQKIKEPKVVLMKSSNFIRRKLLEESMTLLAYLGIKKKYAARPLFRAINLHYSNNPIGLRTIFIRLPYLLRFIDPIPRHKHDVLSQRLEMAASFNAVAQLPPNPSQFSVLFTLFLEFIIFPSRIISGYLRR